MLNEFILDYGFKRNKRNGLFASRLCKIQFTYPMESDVLILKIKNINKYNEIDLFVDDTFAKKFRLNAREIKLIKLDIKGIKSLKFMSNHEIKHKTKSISFAIDNILIDDKRIDISLLKDSQNVLPKFIINSFTKTFSGGIGDFIRGSIFLYRYCKYNNIEFNLDIRYHDINKFLKNENESSIGYSEDEIIDVCNLCSHDTNTMSNFFGKILMNCKESGYVLSSNFISFLTAKHHKIKSTIDHILELKLEEDEINFFKRTFNFSNIINNRYSKWLKDNKIRPKEKYAVFHVRSGDANFVKSEKICRNYLTEPNVDVDFLYKEMIEFQKNNNIKIIFLSDSNNLKETIRKKSKANRNIIVSDSISTHCVNNPGILRYLDEVEYNYVDLKMEDLVFDIKIFSRATSINCFSVYDWGSGLSSWIAKIYDIPLSIKQIKPIDSELKDKASASEVIPYWSSPKLYRLEIEYKKSDSILDYFSSLINLFFLSDEYDTKISAYKFPEFLQLNKSENFTLYSKYRIEDDNNFKSLEKICEKCCIANKEPFFMKRVIKYGEHFCSDINIFKKRFIYQNYIKPLIVRDKNIKPNKPITIISDGYSSRRFNSEDITKRETIFLFDSPKIKRKFLSENKTTNLESYLISEKIDLLLNAQEVIIYNSKYTSLISSICLNLKKIYIPKEFLEYTSNQNIKSLDIDLIEL